MNIVEIMKTVTVKRDGTVMVAGKVAGSVEVTRKDTSMISALSGRPGPKRYVPIGQDGRELTAPFSTRREAVLVVVKCSLPVMVEGMKLVRALRGAMVWEASIDVKGYGMMVSRYSNESSWHVDLLMGRGAICPTFANGTGARPSRALTDQESIDALNRAAIAAGAIFTS